MLESLPFFADTGLSDWILWGLIVASFATSALTAAFGIGGGVALLAIMSLAMPVATLIPLHGIVQMGSNAGRSWHFRHFIKWPFILAFAIGALIGTMIGSQFVVALPEHLLKLILALFVLFLIWGPKPKRVSGGSGAIAIGGGLSSLAGMFVGATGPLVGAIVAGRASERQAIVATHACAMTLQHAFKIVAFGAIGFAFQNWIGLLVAMIASGYAGTVLGGSILKRMPDHYFRIIFKGLLTALALMMLFRALPGFWS